MLPRLLISSDTVAIKKVNKPIIFSNRTKAYKVENSIGSDLNPSAADMASKATGGLGIAENEGITCIVAVSRASANWRPANLRSWRAADRTRNDRPPWLALWHAPSNVGSLSQVRVPVAPPSAGQSGEFFIE